MVREIVARSLERDGRASCADLQGPKIRIGKFETGRHHAAGGQAVTRLSLDAAMSAIGASANTSSLDYKELPRDVKLLAPCCLLERRPPEAGARRAESAGCPQVPHDGPWSAACLSNNKGINKSGRRADRPRADRQGYGRHQDLGDHQVPISWRYQFPEDRERHAYVHAPARQRDAGAAVRSTGSMLIAKMERTEAIVAMDEIMRFVRRHHGCARRPGGGSR